MNSAQTALVAAASGVVALVLLVACTLLWRTTRRLTARIDGLESESRTPQPTSPPVRSQTAAYVITGLTTAESDAEGVGPTKIEGTVFADIVARESAIKAAGLAHGLRRALSAETRNRIRFEMKREVRRSRKQRRADLKAALRDIATRERAGMSDEDAA